ncbi:ABC transporter ATP-binding protein [Polynucleobacter sp. MG-Unter2-18]|uniref:ABC transporter ATP-binding protein n=1 Tax=Polynucleobacter sp. MG-Unter2-18 TaxID=2081052 RepID=UPI001BFD4508|nr:ABC transporter ATP-binding protein [Polynucleobacter sp. MG-Unter2-18]
MSKSELSLPLMQLLSQLWVHISLRRRTQLLLLLLLMLIVSILEVFSIGTVLPFLGVLTSPDYIYDHPLAQGFITMLGIREATDLLLPMAAVFIIAAVAAGASRLFLLWATMRLSYAIGIDLGISIYRKTLYQSYSTHVARNSSVVIHGISVKAPSVTSEVIQPVLIILSSTFMLSVIMSGLFYFDPAVALFALTGFGCIYALVIRVTRRRLLRDSQVIASEGTKVIRVLQEGMGAIRDILIDGSQDAYCRAYQEANRALCHAQARLRFFGQSPRFVLEALGMVLMAVLAYNLAVQENGLITALPILGVLAMSAQRLMPVVQQAYGAWASIQGSKASLEDTLALLNQRMPDNADKPASPLPFEHSIVLRDVCFRYDTSANWVLNGINLTIQKGQRVGFIGTTGSGKSTLLDIVMALLEPNSGTLEVDGIPVTAANQRAWQVHLAHVPQSIFLSDGTVESNIALGVPLSDIDALTVRHAAKQARMAEVIESMPMQYQTAVGERGVRLSGGQRQRIGIARALYKKADVIVLDEATSALDNETEAAVMEEIEGLDKHLTVFIIAHRLTTLKNCSLIVCLIDGRIEKTGTYEDLVQS